MKATIQEVPIKDIQIIENVRTSVNDDSIKELMHSIKQHGLEQPIKVGSTKSNKFTLIFGQRRLTACKKLGWNTIAAQVVDEPDMKQLLVRNVIENLQRKDNSPSELGRICSILAERFDMTHEEIAVSLSIPKVRVTNAMAIYGGLPEEVREKIKFMGKGGESRNGMIPASVANYVLTIKKEFKLSDILVAKLLGDSRTHDLTKYDLEIVAKLIRNGLTPTDALKTKDLYRNFHLKPIIENAEIEAAAKKAKVTANVYLEGILYGQYKPLTRPDFI